MASTTVSVSAFNAQVSGAETLPISRSFVLRLETGSNNIVLHFESSAAALAFLETAVVAVARAVVPGGPELVTT